MNEEGRQPRRKWLDETVETRDQRKYLTTLVHDEWLETVIAGHDESYRSWSEYAAWLILIALPEQRDGS